MDLAWKQIEDVTRMMAVALVQRGISQAACAHTAADEAAVETWLHRWLADELGLELPAEPVHLQLLLARFRYASATATTYRVAQRPLPKSPASATLSLLVLEMWHLLFRERWLRGELGVMPSEN
jgi:hypothetical protein